MEQLGANVAAQADRDIRIYLSGELAAGKTTFARGYVCRRGHLGAVKSPTFTLVESYQFDRRSVHHFDLYRLEDAQELEYIGLDEYFTHGADCLIEWPEKGFGALPTADLAIRLAVIGKARDVEIRSQSEYGSKVLKLIELNYLNSAC